MFHSIFILQCESPLQESVSLTSNSSFNLKYQTISKPKLSSCGVFHNLSYILWESHLVISSVPIVFQSCFPFRLHSSEDLWTCDLQSEAWRRCVATAENISTLLCSAVLGEVFEEEAHRKNMQNFKTIVWICLDMYLVYLIVTYHRPWQWNDIISSPFG